MTIVKISGTKPTYTYLPTHKPFTPKGKEHSEETYWTCFVIEGEHPNDLHITHKFLGLLSTKEIDAVKFLIGDFFSKNKIKKTTLIFATPDLFGLNRSVLVVRTKKIPKWIRKFSKLRNKLSFISDNYDYTPHIATQKTELHPKVVSYALIQGSDILIQWHFE